MILLEVTINYTLCNGPHFIPLLSGVPCLIAVTRDSYVMMAWGFWPKRKIIGMHRIICESLVDHDPKMILGDSQVILKQFLVILEQSKSSSIFIAYQKV